MKKLSFRILYLHFTAAVAAFCNVGMMVDFKSEPAVIICCENFKFTFSFTRTEETTISLIHWWGFPFKLCFNVPLGGAKVKLQTESLQGCVCVC